MQNIHDLEPVLRIGKNGVTENIINDIKILVKKKKNVKIKVLRSALNSATMDQIADKIVEEANLKIVQLRGHSVVVASR
ncbi:MAG: YhbY family RNA-binding protein [Candidatus Thermoplasmatota archaeon]|nr:YhbY family RNA-binding protein [Candidatus Thermoplasmatota archaeon]